MKWIRTALLPLVALIAACGLDGGSRGTGMTTINGNVASVESATGAQPAASASARTILEGIGVTVEEKGLQTRTDANGFFALHGIFEGAVSLRFDRPDDSASARITVDVPGGGTLQLEDVRINSIDGTASADREDVAFDGRIVGTNCSAKTLQLVSRQNFGDGDTYTVRLDNSALHDRRGSSVSCASLRDGQDLNVHGLVNDDGTFGQADIEVQD